MRNHTAERPAGRIIPFGTRTSFRRRTTMPMNSIASRPVPDFPGNPPPIVLRCAQDLRGGFAAHRTAQPLTQQGSGAGSSTCTPAPRPMAAPPWSSIQAPPPAVLAIPGQTRKRSSASGSSIMTTKHLNLDDSSCKRIFESAAKSQCQSASRSRRYSYFLPFFRT